jgi:hypothetical protein
VVYLLAAACALSRTKQPPARGPAVVCCRACSSRLRDSTLSASIISAVRSRWSTFDPVEPLTAARPTATRFQCGASPFGEIPLDQRNPERNPPMRPFIFLFPFTNVGEA